jgi:FkbM family methyltransferase
MPHILKRAFRKLLTPLLWGCTSAEMQTGRISFSQFGEDVICGFFFPRDYRGVYVDIGAAHPMLLSNTYHFYRSGWRGICVDANPDAASLFCKFRPQDTFIHMAVGAESGVVELATFKDSAFNCLTEHLPDVPEEIRDTAQIIKVPMEPLSKILAVNKIMEIDLLSVDCEGNDLAVLKSNDWARWKPKVIIVEDHAADWTNSSITKYLNSVGYKPKDRAVFYSIFLTLETAAIHDASRGLKPIV